MVRRIHLAQFEFSLACRGIQDSLGFQVLDGPFPSSPEPLYQNEVKCSAFDMEIIFILMQITHFQKEGCALDVILKVRGFGTRKWPIHDGLGF